MDEFGISGGQAVPPSKYGGGKVTFPDGQTGQLSVSTGVTVYRFSTQQAMSDASEASLAGASPVGPVVGLPAFLVRSVQVQESVTVPGLVGFALRNGISFDYSGPHADEVRFLQTYYLTVYYKQKDLPPQYWAKQVKIRRHQARTTVEPTKVKERYYVHDCTETPYVYPEIRSSANVTFPDVPTTANAAVFAFRQSMPAKELNSIEWLDATVYFDTFLMYRSRPLYRISWTTSQSLLGFADHKAPVI